MIYYPSINRFLHIVTRYIFSIILAIKDYTGCIKIYLLWRYTTYDWVCFSRSRPHFLKKCSLWLEMVKVRLVVTPWIYHRLLNMRPLSRDIWIKLPLTRKPISAAKSPLSSDWSIHHCYCSGKSDYGRLLPGGKVDPAGRLGRKRRPPENGAR